jgi:hypothetical protein
MDLAALGWKGIEQTYGARNDAKGTAEPQGNPLRSHGGQFDASSTDSEDRARMELARVARAKEGGESDVPGPRAEEWAADTRDCQAGPHHGETEQI